MLSRRLLAALTLLSLAGAVIAGCGDSAKVLSAEEAERVLRKLPYRYEFESVEVPKGASDAFAARVHGPHRTTVSISVALGDDAHPVPVPPAGFFNVVGDPGFVFNNDLLVPVGGKTIQSKGVRTGAQWRTATSMLTAIEESLCRETTGEPCPV